MGSARLTLGALAYMALPALLVFAEPDFGTALVYAAVTLGHAVRAGRAVAALRWLGLGFVVAMAMVFSIMPGIGVPVIKQYQMDRLTAFLHPSSSNIQGDGYHLTQSMIAVGHGGVGGTGSPAPRRRGSTTCPSTRPTSSSRWWARSAASSARSGCWRSTRC